METGWLNLQQDQYAKLEDASQELNLTERLGIQHQLQKQIHQNQQAQQVQQVQTTHAPQTPVVGTKRKRGSTAKERISKMPPCTAGKRSSIYRGVTRHRWTGRYEAHLWDKGTWNHTQNKKGKQVYLGAYDDEEAAARAYDLAALKYWGPGTLINFPVTDYTRDIEEMQNVSREEYLASLRRKSSGFSRGVSKYRGVARHHHNGRWEARIGRVFGNKYLYLGTYGTQEEAATAYDMAAIEYRGLNAVTNFDLSRYIRWLRPGQGNNLPGQESNEQTGVSPKDTEVSGVEFADEILQVDQSSKCTSENNTSTRVWPSQTSEPYQLPTLGLARAAAQNSLQKKSDAPTALGILLQSNMFRQMLEKTSSTSGSNNMSSRNVGEVELHENNQVGGDMDGSQYLVGAEGVYHPGGEVTIIAGHGETDDGYTPFQHDFGLTTGQQQGEQHEGDNVGHEGEGDGGAGLSLWSSFGSNFGTLPMTNAISTC